MKMKSFSRYLSEGKNAITFSFGRFNPPTIGHGKLLDKMKTVSGQNSYRMYLSLSNDQKKNPLIYSDKVKWVRKLFPKHGRNIIYDTKLINVFSIATKLYNEGFTDVTMVVGSDRIREFKLLLDKYNGVKGRHGFYNFDSINVVSAGERDPDAEGVSGMSASKMRAAASDNDFTSFSKGIPSSVSTKDSKKLFNVVRSSMGLKESTNYHNHIKLEKVSNIREKYINEELYVPGDMVEDENGNEYLVAFCGANYLLVEDHAGIKSRKWLDSVRRVDETTDRWYKDKPEWGTPEASKKAKRVTPGEDPKTDEKDLKEASKRITSTKGINYHNATKRVDNKNRIHKLFSVRKSKLARDRMQKFNDRNLDQARKIDYGRYLRTRLDTNA